MDYWIYENTKTGKWEVRYLDNGRAATSREFSNRADAWVFCAYGDVNARLPPPKLAPYL